MLINYHTHTKRCKHAEGEDEEYIVSAIERGVKVLGFSDHAPMPYHGGYSSYYKMETDEIGEYFSSLLSLRKKYADKIDIKIGFETEYYPSLWEESLALWKNYPIDYLILGQHFATEEIYDPNAIYSGKATENPEHLKLYTDTVITAINTGKITFIAHPDLMNFKGDESFHRSEARRLIREAMRLNVPIEINLLGLVEKRDYPKDLFWEEAGRLGAAAVLGCDAHSPKRVANPDELLLAEAFAKKHGVKIVEDVPLCPVF